MAFSFSSWFKGNKSPDDESEPGEASQENAPATPPHVTLRPPAGVTPGTGVHTAQPGARPPIRTAMPNAVQPVSLRDQGQQRAPVPLGTRPPPVSAAKPKLSPSMPPARKIAFGGPGAPAAAMPSAPAPAAEPSLPPASVPESVVTLTVGDFIDRLPPGLLAPGEHSRDEEVQFLSTELYSDLSKGRASVPASAIYAKIPTLFARAIDETEDAEVQLPLYKIVEQMSAALQTRHDQVSEVSAAEIETPFLHVANEDNARLPKATGTTVGALPAAVSRNTLRRTGQISAISPLKTPAETNPPLAAPLAPAVPINQTKKPPSTVRASVAGGKIRLNDGTTAARPAISMPSAPVPAAQENSAAHAVPPLAAASPSHQVIKKTARIQIPPISLRTAGAAGPRPPASFAPPSAQPPAAQPPSFRSVPPAEQPMPTFRPAPPAGDPNTANFRVSPPPVPPSTKRVPSSFAPGARPSFPPPAFPAVPPAPASSPAAPQPAAAAPVPAPVQDDRTISLSLPAILKGLPSSMLTVSPSSLTDDQRVTLPFSMIERQLSQGRISIPTSVFVEALPENHRDVLAAGFDLQEISIPLQEVFQNLPANALTIRPDQVFEEATNLYPTPFSQKAEEDAARLGRIEAVKPVDREAEAAVEETAPEAVADAPAADSPVIEPEDTAVAETPEIEETPEIASESFVDNEEASQAYDQSPEAVEAATDESAEAVALLSADALHEGSTPEQEDTPADAPITLAEVEEIQTEASAEPIEMQSVSEEAPSEVAGEPAFAHDVQPADEAPVETFAAESAPADEPVPSPEAHAPEYTQEPEPSVDIAAPALPVAVAVEPAFGTDEISAATLPETLALPAVPPLETRPATVQPKDTVLQTLFMTEDDMDAKTIVRHVCQLPGVSACAVMFGDGLPLAGNFPDGHEKAGFTAMAPPYFKRSTTFSDDLNLGGLEALTLYTDKGLISFFMHGDICMSVRHGGRGFLPGVREKLVVVTRELARTYSPEPAGNKGH